MSSAPDLISVAAAEVGYSRWDDPSPGTKYGRWYEQNVDRCATNYNYGASGVPYCAMFVSWCLVTAGVVASGFPSAYCPAIHNHQTLKASQMVAGDIVLFDWELDGTDDHVGIVEWNDPAKGRMGTIEGNTNNGKVARRTRYYKNVCGGIRPNWDEKPVSTPSEVLQVESLKIDGWWGPATTIKAQRVFETVQDGFISGQNRKSFNSVNRGGLELNAWKLGTDGSQLIRAIQEVIGVKIDGDYGQKSCKAQQAYLGTTQDGVVSGPSKMVKAFQTWLNKQVA